MLKKLGLGTALVGMLLLVIAGGVQGASEDEPLCIADTDNLVEACLDNGCEADTGVCGKASSGGSCWCLY